MLSRSFLNWLESNLVSILLAVLLALIVWIVATQETNPPQEITFDQPIPIEWVGPPSGYTITNRPPETARLRLRVFQDTRDALDVEDFTVTADLTGLGEGSHDITLVAGTAAQVVILRVLPASVRVELEAISEREVPIQLVELGTLPVGYSTEESALAPSSVRITGPQSQVDLVSEVRATADLDGRRDTFQDILPLVALDNEGQTISGVTLLPASASVTIPIIQEADFREVAVRVNANVQPAPGYYVSRIAVDPPLVPVRGDPELLRTLSAIETQPITLTGLREQTTVVAQLQPPNGVTLEEIQTVDVSISVEAQPDFEVVEVPVGITGLTEGYEATVLPGNAVVSLAGPLPVLQDLVANQVTSIIVTVDLTGLEPGGYQLEPRVELVSADIPAEDLELVVVESVLPTLIEIGIVDPAAEEEEGT